MDSIVVNENSILHVQAEDDTGKDLDGFTYAQYEKYFPDEVKDILGKSLHEKSYGWKARARKLLRIDGYASTIKELQEDLVEMCTGKRTRNPFLDARSRIRTLLSAASEEKLQELCVKNDVNYASFMNTNDKVGLVEAIVDEMLRDLVPA